MQEMVTGISSTSLLAASEVNRIAFWSPYGRGQGCTLYTAPDVVWFYSGIQDPLFNGVIWAEMERDAVGGTVDRLHAEIDAHGVPALWWVGPRSRPRDLGALLEGRGLELAGETPGMAVDLRSMDDRPGTAAGLTVRQVTDRQTRALWARVAAVGTGFSEDAVETIVRLEAGLGDDAQYRAQRRYIGYLDDTPVATSALVLEGGVAGVYGVATLPQARRRGIGTQMTLAPLLEAREMGYRVGILQASSMGHAIYERIGFRDVCTYRIYLQSS
jgi:ribosomal protein S18 acetylase RimI-like enzyme